MNCLSLWLLICDAHTPQSGAVGRGPVTFAKASKRRRLSIQSFVAPTSLRRNSFKRAVASRLKASSRRRLFDEKLQSTVASRLKALPRRSLFVAKLQSADASSTQSFKVPSPLDANLQRVVATTTCDFATRRHIDAPSISNHGPTHTTAFVGTTSASKHN